MNGQMYQACCITAAVKKALKSQSSIAYTPLNYESTINFQFLPEKKLLGTKTYKAESTTEWYNYCLKKGLEDVMFLAPQSVKDRGILGFSNTTQSSIGCFYKKTVTYFTPCWKFDDTKQKWDILYTENEWNDPPIKKLSFNNNSDDFKAVLIEIKELAYKIHCDSFAVIFQKALDLLCGTTQYSQAISNMPLPEIPEENMRLFGAASTADVFGAMGSWNDSPPYMAHDKGMSKEYDQLSDELLKQVRLGALYAINEW